MGERLPRKLAAILYADVAGYSRLTGEDEDATHRTLSEYLDRISRVIESHRGQVMHYAGDAVLAKFDAVVDAMSAAVTIQSELKTPNESLPSERKVEFRIGVNSGDVIEDRGDIYGDGVNVAARLESLGEAGGICISESVHTAIGNKLPLNYEFMGEQDVKNIDKPVRAYRVMLDGNKKKTTKSSSETSPSMSDKPSIAVLPFTNMSGDPEQEHFCDGITEDIITSLSRSRWYNVTSRNSTFAYKGRSPDVREVAQTLGVGYVLEGSVRKGGNRIRVTVQLIDAETGNHVWADRFNRELEDEFAIQDEIAHRVASILGERIWQDVAKNIGHKRPETYGPYEHAFLGVELLHRLDPDEISRAKSYFSKALEIDRDFIPGHLGLGFCYLCDWAFWDDPSGRALDEAHQHALKLQELAPDDAQTFRLLSRVFCAKRMYDEARRFVERALRINADDGDIIGNKGVFLMCDGNSQEAIEWLDKVLELHSETPHTVDIMLYWKALAQFSSFDYQTAVATLKGISGLDFLKNMLLAACYAQLDRGDEAKAMSQAVLQVRPNLHLSDVGLCDYFRREEDQQHLRDALCKAGIPAGTSGVPSLELPD
jgi:adenylate cyclase